MTPPWLYGLLFFCMAIVPSSAISAINLAGCGIAGKMCVKHPPSCTGPANCLAIVTHEPHPGDSGLVNFELARSINGGTQYVAVGFSRDRNMGDDFVVSCVQQYPGRDPVVVASYNENIGGRLSNNFLQLGDTISNVAPYRVVETGSVDGWIICRYSQERNLGPNTDARIFPLNQAYYLLLAMGEAYEDGRLKIHSLSRSSNYFPSVSTLFDFGSRGQPQTNQPLPTAITAYQQPANSYPQSAHQNFDTTSSVGELSTPSGCSSNCNAQVTYGRDLADNSKVRIKFQGKIKPGQSQYVALGLSADQKMNNDAVTSCMYSGIGQPTARLSFNPNQGNRRNAPLSDAAAQSALQLIRSGTDGQYFSCDVLQDINPTSNSNGEVFNLDNQYYLFLAEGPISSRSNLPGYHPESPLVTGSPVALAQGSSAKTDWLTRDVKKKLKFAHALCLLFGWWVFVANAILFARYFRNMWPGKEWCGIKIWFHVHRGLNLIGVLGIIAGLVCILVAEKGEWVGDEPKARNHAILGLTAIIVAMVQPVGALLRPKPHHKFRPIFNWVHRLLGLAGFGCASAALWFSMEFKSYLHSCMWGTTPMYLMIFYYAALGAVLIALETHLCVTERCKPTKVDADVPLQYMNDPNLPSPPQSHHRAYYHSSWPITRLLILLLFILASLAVTVTLASYIILGPDRSKTCSK